MATRVLRPRPRSPRASHEIHRTAIDEQTWRIKAARISNMGTAINVISVPSVSVAIPGPCILHSSRVRSRDSPTSDCQYDVSRRRWFSNQVPRHAS